MRRIHTAVIARALPLARSSLLALADRAPIQLRALLSRTLLACPDPRV